MYYIFTSTHRQKSNAKLFNSVYRYLFCDGETLSSDSTYWVAAKCCVTGAFSTTYAVFIIECMVVA